MVVARSGKEGRGEVIPLGEEGKEEEYWPLQRCKGNRAVTMMA